MRKITLLLLITLIFSCSDKKQEITKNSVLIELGKKEVLSKLKSPSTAVFIDSLSTVSKLKGDNISYRVKLSVDAKNSFNTILRNKYMLIYESKGNDSLIPQNYILKDFFD